MTLAILLATFALLLVLGMPIAFCLSIASLAALLSLDLSPLVLLQRMFAGVNTFALIAIPFFIYSGELLLHSGASDRMVRFANALVGHWRGGLGQVNVLTSLLFGGISGSAVAGVSAVGGVLIPKMKEEGYDGDYAVNVTISASILGLVIPPSHNLIIYAIAAGGSVSVGNLFLGGIFPGLLTAILLGIAAYAVAVKRGYPTTPFQGWWPVLTTFIAALPGLLMILIIVGGIRLGIFTPTEASAIAVIYGIGVAFLIYRSMDLKKFWMVTGHATKTVASVLFLIAAANAFGWVLAISDTPRVVTELMTSLSDNRLAIFLMINFSLLVLGTVMDMAPLIIIATPIFLPIAQAYGMDPTQFGVMLIMNLGVGLITPPVGTALFVGCAVGQIKVEQLITSIWPFYIAHLVAILLVTFVPAFTLALPGWLS